MYVPYVNGRIKAVDLCPYMPYNILSRVNENPG